MEIPNNLTNPTIDANKVATSLDKIQTGQVLYARVIKELPSKNEVIIRLGEHTLVAKSDIQHTIGQTLKVLVEKTADTLTLKVPVPLAREDIVSTSLRQLLPKQNPVNEFQLPLQRLLTNFNRLSNSQTGLQPGSSSPQLAQLKSLSTDLLSSIPNKDALTNSQGLKTAIQHSGVFLEPRLAKIVLDLKTALNANPDLYKVADKIKSSSEPNLPHQVASTTDTSISRVDLKANLIKLIQQLQAWPKQAPTLQVQQSTNPQTITSNKAVETLMAQNQQLAQLQAPPAALNPRIMAPALDNLLNELILKAEGALAKITLNQLTSANPESSSTRQSWQVEIPFFNQHLTESLFLTIERDTSSKKKPSAEPVWTVSLEMQPPKLGLIKSKISLRNNKINSNFWAANPVTKTLITDHLMLLQEQFKQANLEAENIQVLNGPGPTIQAVKPSVFILNEKA